MLLLALDTAGPDCRVAIARGDARDFQIVTQGEERVGRGHAELLMPMVEAALAAAGAQFEDLDRIAVTTGPGSFTGVRVGIAAARGFALALDIPAVGIGSLAALAFPALQQQTEGTVVAALDAKRGEIYAFAQDAASGAVLIEATAAPPAEIAVKLEGAARPLTLIGAGAPLVAATLGEGRLAATAEAPDIADVAALGLREDAKVPPTPIYARGADDKAVLRL
jgi:tRNA threonylcarbamoyladenosine biosynthesis protein TsaB